MQQVITSGLFVLVLLVCLKWHREAWQEFGEDAAAVKRLHDAGLETPQMVSWAGNQLLRYQYRIVEGTFGILIGLNSILGIWFPQAVHNPVYAFAVLVFFFALIGVSGLLSRRDVRLRRKLRKKTDPLPNVVTTPVPLPPERD